MSESRNVQITRIIHLVSFLVSSRLPKTVQQIFEHLQSARFDVTDRTVRRDLSLLQSTFMDMRVEENEGNSMTYSMEAKDLTTGISSADPQSVFGYFLLKGLSEKMQQSEFSGQIQSSLKNLESGFSNRLKDYLQELDQSTVFSNRFPQALHAKSDILTTLQIACSESQIVEAVYESTNSGVKQRRLAPHVLYFEGTSFYLIAEDCESKTIKVYSLARFKSAERTEESFEARTIDPKALFAKNFGIFSGGKSEAIVLEFEKALALYISENVWHTSQRIEDIGEGKIRLHLELAVTPDFVNWVMGFGDMVTVQAPSSLVDRIYEIACKLQTRYKAKQAV